MTGGGPYLPQDLADDLADALEVLEVVLRLVVLLLQVPHPQAEAPQLRVVRLVLWRGDPYGGGSGVKEL